MFKNGTFRLSGPICQCKKESLWFGIGKDREGRSTLYFECYFCGSRLTVGHEQFRMAIALDQGYPEGRHDDKPSKKSTDGKVIEFPRE